MFILPEYQSFQHIFRRIDIQPVTSDEQLGQ